MRREIVEGKIQGNERGYAFLLPTDTTKKDYFISHSDLKGAMHGDTVLAETTDGVGDRTTARVLKIINRGITELVGTYFTSRSGGRVVPDESKYFCDIFIPFGKGVRARAGEKVICKILAYPRKRPPEGIVTKVLGRQFDKKAELNSILFTYKMPEGFSKQVIESAKQVAKPVTQKDIDGRLDLRGELTITIDGDDAKDFDDAISIKKLSDGKYKLGVHIADVSHYVTLGGIIDKEAFSRATSVYFPESVIPMLPESLCNDVCSLKEGVDRLTLSCIMMVNNKGEVIDRLITPSVIKSSARMTYSNVTKILYGNKELSKKYDFLLDTLKDMSDLADILTAKRTAKGCIDLDVKESAISVDKFGNIQISASPRDKSHKIIEEFMILANVTVAEYMYYLDKPFIYRIHEKPNPERLENFYNFLKGLGVSYKRKKDEVFSKDFQTILNNAENTGAFTLINRVMLRSMQKAKYSPDCLGHFGLSEEQYCHFTSPIRRYPDLMIHRIIKDFLAGQENIEEKYGNLVESASVQSSEKERNATEAERTVDDYYKILYISNYEGEEFDAVISGVTGFGLFAELSNGVEGLIKLETLKGKRYNYDKDKFILSNGKYTYRLGQSVKIMVAGVNIMERRAEFVLVE